MKKIIYKATGGVLIFGAILGLLLTIAVLSLAWLKKPAFQNRINRDLDLLNRTLVSTENLLRTVDDSLIQLEESRSMLDAAMQNLSAAINDVTPAIDSLSDLVGKDYYDIVTSTQTSLRSIQSSAQLIDNTLRIISSLPLIGARYAPEEPIHVSIENMIQALETAPQKLTDIGSSLKDSAINLRKLRTDLEQLSQNMANLETNITQARQTIQDYQSILEEAEEETIEIQKKINTWLNLTLITVTLFCLWMIIVQITIFTQGLEIYNQGDRFYKHPHDPT